MELSNGEESIEARLWRQFSPTGSETTCPARHDFSGALFEMLDGRLGNGPFEDLRRAALMAVDDCLAYNAAPSSTTARPDAP